MLLLERIFELESRLHGCGVDGEVPNRDELEFQRRRTQPQWDDKQLAVPVQMIDVDDSAADFPDLRAIDADVRRFRLQQTATGKSRVATSEQKVCRTRSRLDLREQMPLGTAASSVRVKVEQSGDRAETCVCLQVRQTAAGSQNAARRSS